MKNPVLVGLVALIFTGTQLCVGIAISPQVSQTEGPTHDEDVSDFLQNLLPSSEDHVLQLPFGQESPSLGRDVLQRVLTAVHKELVVSRKAHDDDIARLDDVISRLSSDVQEIKDILAAQAVLETTTPDPAPGQETTGDDAAAAAGRDRRTTSVEGLAVGNRELTPSTGTSDPDGHSDNEDSAEEHDASGDPDRPSENEDSAEEHDASGDPDRPSENEDGAEEYDASGDPDAEDAHQLGLTLTRHTPLRVSYIPVYTPWWTGRLSAHQYPRLCHGLLSRLRDSWCAYQMMD